MMIMVGVRVRFNVFHDVSRTAVPFLTPNSLVGVAKASHFDDVIEAIVQIVKQHQISLCTA